MKELVERQLPIAEENLSRFSRYFREDWLNAKVTRLDDLAFLRHLGSSARSVQVQLTIDYLLKRYEWALPVNFDVKFNARSMAELDKSSQILLEEFMAALHLKHRTQEDFSLPSPFTRCLPWGTTAPFGSRRGKPSRKGRKQFGTRRQRPVNCWYLTMHLSVLTCRIHIGFQR
ncbi:MAG: hypothetical protein ACLSHU_01840 [Oscillospiraceae bacterium]